MPLETGNVEFIAGSEEPQIFQIKSEGKPYTMAEVTNLTLWLKETGSGGAQRSITGAKLFVSDEDNGEITLNQEAADFPDKAAYYYYFKFTQGGKIIKVPNDPKKNVIKVNQNFES